MAYLTKDGLKNEYQEFLLTPRSLENLGEDQKIMIPSSLLEQANIPLGEDKHLIIADNDRVKETLRQVGYFSLISGYNEHKAWGNKFIENLAADIRREFPGSKGYSVRNLSKSRLDLYGSRICADSVCTNPLVTQYSNYGQCQGS